MNPLNSLLPVKKMQKAISYFYSPMSSSKRWVGMKAQCLISMLSRGKSASESAQGKLDALLKENKKLQEEIRILQDSINSEYDV